MVININILFDTVNNIERSILKSTNKTGFGVRVAKNETCYLRNKRDTKQLIILLVIRSSPM